MSESDEIGRWSALAEGQFFERKSAFEKPGARPRKATGIAWDIAETLSAMANADGGELVVGMEDDGEPTGVPHPPDKVRLLLQAPRERSGSECAPAPRWRRACDCGAEGAIIVVQRGNGTWPKRSRRFSRPSKRSVSSFAAWA